MCATRTVERSGRRPLFPSATTPPDTLPDMAKVTAGSSMCRTGFRSICCKSWLSAIPIKISRLKIKNVSGRRRRLSVTAYMEWVLGPSRAACAPYIVTEIDPETGALLARNPWRMESARVWPSPIWLAGNGMVRRSHGVHRPQRHWLAGRARQRKAAVQPCRCRPQSLRRRCKPQSRSLPNGEVEITFSLGEAATDAKAISLVERYRAADLDRIFRDVTEYWDQALGAVQVRTPDRAMDILLNRWLLYQTIVCRMWARSGFYQASGAYGFRDQLQDGMALCVSKPGLTREHLLRAAAPTVFRR